MRIARSPLIIAVTVVVLLLTACGTSPRRPPTRAAATVVKVAATPDPAAPTTSVSVAPPDPAVAVEAQLSEAQRVGQLFMVGTSATAIDPDVLGLVTSGQVGSVFLAGNSTRPVGQTAAMIAALQQAAGPVGLFVATDQEGGTVQRLAGPNFAPIPSALDQGRQPAATERANALAWGTALAAAGINVNLAPVMDTVPSATFAPRNPPIGALDREFGYSPDVVTAGGTAFAQGMLDAGIDPTAKHFPGLGRVTGNTDTTAGVTDSTTTRTDPDVAPFAAAVNAGVPFVMMSLATYSQIDPANPAAFSPAIVTGMLRGDLHFGGVVISDDLGATKSVAAYSVGDRAVDFIAAGGDVVLDVSAGQIAPMAAAVLARAQADPAFAAQVNAAALVVLQTKQGRALLH